MELTLYQIEDGLAQLIEYRAERLADPTCPATAEELAAIDCEIDKYHFAEPAKVAGIAGIFRSWRAKRANAKEEIGRLQGIIKSLDAMEERLKERIQMALELLPLPAKGARKITGHEGSVISLKGNGGLQPLQVDGWDAEREEWRSASVLPEHLLDIQVKMPLAGWNYIRQHLGEFGLLMLSDSIDRNGSKITPNNSAIRAALAESCTNCLGHGKVGHAIDRPADCSACGGTGKRIVPGARLLPRGSHVEVR